VFSLFAPVARADGPIGLYPDSPDLVWRGDFEGGYASLQGNCDLGRDGYCISETIRPEQIQIVENPVAQGHLAARFEVRYGDVFSYYSDSRSLLDPSLSGYFGEGDDLWYRWQIFLPQDFVADYPKWDELGWDDESTTARSASGLNISVHHPGDGSAPLYMGATREGFYACIVEWWSRSCTDDPRRRIMLTPALIKGRWVDFLVHAHWTSGAGGSLQFWVDGNYREWTGPTMFPYEGRTHWLVVGLYRNGHIGERGLYYRSGQEVYTRDDGTPTVVYLDGFAIGRTRDAVMSAGTLDNPNLLLNGDFSQCLTAWALWDVPRIGCGDREGLISAGDGTARFAQQVTLQRNRQYRLSFRMRAEGVSGYFQAMVNDASSGESRLPGQALTYSDWQGYRDYSFTFNSGDSASAWVYVGNWGGSTGTAYLTSLSLVDVTP
jgi:hypothetical protein